MTAVEHQPSIHVDTADPSLTLEPDGEEVSVEDALAAARARADHLEQALQASRIIGMAIGIVIERCRLSPDEAFELLRTISQRDHRKLRDLASDLVFTGVVPEPS